jgi:hypothetical protein
MTLTRIPSRGPGSSRASRFKAAASRHRRANPPISLRVAIGLARANSIRANEKNHLWAFSTKGICGSSKQRRSRYSSSRAANWTARPTTDLFFNLPSDCSPDGLHSRIGQQSQSNLVAVFRGRNDGAGVRNAARNPIRQLQETRHRALAFKNSTTFEVGVSDTIASSERAQASSASFLSCKYSKRL